MDLSGFSNSIKRSASLAWNSSGCEIFSSSSRQKDDEEALKWAALEKLPTFDRLRKGLLFGSRGIADVDVQDLVSQERKKLLQRLVNVVEEDNEKFLLKLKNRIDRVGIELPTIEVRFKNLKVETEVHIGSRTLPTFTNFFTNLLEEFSNYLRILPSRKKQLVILNNVDGILKPGRMTLLLGPPSSGRTTLLRALAGILDPTLKVSGSVTYNGHDMKEFVPQRIAAYVSQHDVHTGEMTVRETLAFSARCQGVGNSREMLAELSRREKLANIKPDPDIDVFMKATATEGQDASMITEYILKILGLEICADSMVGDHMIRGISGGQRKCVTTGEMLVGPLKTLFMDEISTGLDSFTTFQVVNSIKQYIRIFKGTALISLLQPEPETYNLFDDIILISDGKILYQGPRESALEFFQRMGFRCPRQKGVAGFLQEVTSKNDQQQFWEYNDKPYKFVTAGEFVEACKSFHAGQKLIADLESPFDKSKSHLAALASKKYGISKRELLKACASREILLIKRNSFTYIFRILRLIIMAILTMTVFFHSKMHRDNLTDGRMFYGVLFFTVNIFVFGGMSEIGVTIQRLPVFYKHREFLFYPAWTYGLPAWIIKIPTNVVEVFAFVVLSYYVIGYDPNIGRLLKLLLVLFTLVQTASSMCRFIGAVSRNMDLGNTNGIFILLLVFALSGFILPQGKIKKGWIWGYWSSPMMYAGNAIIVNEFTGHSWKHISSNGNPSLGIEVIKSSEFFSSAYWYWIGVGALLGMMILYNFCFILALTYLKPIGKAQTILPDDSTKIASENDVLHAKIGTEGENKRRGIILSFEPHSMVFNDVKYSVDMPQEMKEQGMIEDKFVLLKSVSGSFRPGVLTALMGSIGAGKTTLMDVLAGRKTGGYIEGNITISGYPKNHETFTRIIGYCEQNDIHSPCITVYESLLFSAWLRLPRDVIFRIRKIFVENVMEIVELTPLKGRLVGLPGVNGLSTEQRKRLTIAVELVANPSILFMDEPTSGLDARAAEIVMRTVRNTVDTGRTVVCTIHQPSIDIFESFDELVLMKQGGQEIYVGPLGQHSSHLIRYLEGIKGVAKIRDGCNPATWMLDVTSTAQEIKLGIDFSEVYKNSELYRRNKSLIHELITPRPDTRDLHFPTPQPFFTQCMACLWKQHRSYWQNPLYTAVRFLYTVFLALVFGSMFRDLGSKKATEEDLLTAMGSMYASVLFLGMQYSTSVQPVVVVERIVFYREQASGMYSAIPYAFALAAVEIPYSFLQAVIYGTIVYAMIRFEWTASKYFWYIFFMFFTLLYFIFYGMMAVALTPNQHISSIISPTFFSIWNLVSGFLIPRPRTPMWWRWCHWACPVAWTLYGLFASQYGDITDQLNTKQSVKDFVDSYFGFKHDYVIMAAAMVVGFAVLFVLGFAFFIGTLNFQRR